RMIKVGNLVPLNAPAFRVVDNSRLEAVLNVPEREMATLVPGLPLRMKVDAIPGKVFEGVVDRVSPVVDAGSGTFRVVAAFAGGGQLRPGMFGRIDVVYDERQDALTMPRVALLENEGEPAVFVVREEKAVRVPVQLGYMNGEFAEVRAGLNEGDAVVTAGKVAIRDGSAVEVINTEPVPAAAASEPAVAQADWHAARRVLHPPPDNGGDGDGHHGAVRPDRRRRSQGQPAARSELSDPDRAHRVHRCRTGGNRDTDQRTGRAGRRRGQEPAQVALDLPHRPKRRGAGVRLGHRHGPGQPRGARQARGAEPAAG